MFGLWVVTGTDGLEPLALVGSAARPFLVGGPDRGHGSRRAAQSSPAAGGATGGHGRRARRPGPRLRGGVVLMLLVTGVVAAVTPPNNWDGNVYHLPRRDLFGSSRRAWSTAPPASQAVMMPPMAEFIGTHFPPPDRRRPLGESDPVVFPRSDGAGGIAQWRGSSAPPMRGQSLAALLVVTNPMAAMQAMNFTKNDLVLSLWVCAFAYFALVVWTQPLAVCRAGPCCSARRSASCYSPRARPIPSPPRSAWSRAWRSSLAAGSRVAKRGHDRPHRSRPQRGALRRSNLGEFGSPIESKRMRQRMVNETFSPAAVVSNAVRNLMLHAGTPSDAADKPRARVGGGSAPSLDRHRRQRPPHHFRNHRRFAVIPRAAARRRPGARAIPLVACAGRHRAASPSCGGAGVKRCSWPRRSPRAPHSWPSARW